MSRSASPRKVAALSIIPLFEGLSDEELASVADLMTEREVTAGAVLAEEAAPGDEVMIVLSGTAVVQRSGRVVDEIGEGDFFGEMSLINRAPRNATVTASSDTTLLVMTSGEFFSVLETNPMISIKVLRTVAARVAANEDPGTI